MTYEEAISRIKKIAESSRDVSSVGMYEQRPIVTSLNMAIESLKKQIPKKPKSAYQPKFFWCDCGLAIQQKVPNSEVDINYCPYCGQAVDFSE